MTDKKTVLNPEIVDDLPQKKQAKIVNEDIIDVDNISKDEILHKIKELNSQYAELLKNEEILNILQKIMSFDKSEIKNIENKIKDIKQRTLNQEIIQEINDKYDKYNWYLDNKHDENCGYFYLINNKLLKLMKLRKFYHDAEQKLQKIYEKYENKQKLENIIILYYEILEIK